jgi:hypothetical protein
LLAAEHPFHEEDLRGAPGRLAGGGLRVGVIISGVFQRGGIRRFAAGGRRPWTATACCSFPRDSLLSAGGGWEVIAPQDAYPHCPVMAEGGHLNETRTESNIGFDGFDVVSLMRSSKPNFSAAGSPDRSISAGVRLICFEKPSMRS